MLDHEEQEFDADITYLFRHKIKSPEYSMIHKIKFEYC